MDRGTGPVEAGRVPALRKGAAEGVAVPWSTVWVLK